MNARWIVLGLLAGIGAIASGQSLQERIDVASAGAVIEVAAGAHSGPITIDRPLTLRGIDYPLIEGNGRDHVVRITAPGVTVEGFRIENSGLSLSADHAGVFIVADDVVVRNNRIERVLHGIYVKGVNRARIEKNTIDGLIYVPENHADVLREGFSSRPTELCTVALDASRRGNGIHLWNGEGHQVVDNTVRQTRDGIYFSFTNRTWIYRNRVSRVRYGLHYMYSDENTFEENTFTESAAGAAIMYSKRIRAEGNQFFNNRGKRSYGLLLQSVDDSTFSRNQVTENTIGAYFENSQNNRFTGNRLERNYVGIRFSASSAGNRFTENGFQRNLHPVEMDQSERANVWSEDGRGNDWGNPGSPDLDGDGVGDWPHFESDVLGRLRREHELVGLLSGSAFVDLLHFAASRTRLKGLPSVEDPNPLQSNK